MNKIDLEVIYNKDYQNETYRARIIDESNKTLINGTKIFFSKEEAYEDGKELLKVLDRKKIGLDFVSKKWIGPFQGKKHYNKPILYFIIVLTVVIFVPLLCLVLTEIFGEIVILIACLSVIPGIPVLIVLGNYICREKYIFMLDDDILYAVYLINNVPVSTTGILAVDAINFGAHYEEEDAIKKIYSYVNDIDDFKRFHIKSMIFEIIKVVSIKEYGKKKYKVNCIVKKRFGDKEKNRNFYFSDYFTEYDSLLKMLNYIKENHN